MLNFYYKLAIFYLFMFVISLFLFVITRFSLFSLLAATSLILSRIECVIAYLEETKKRKK